MTDDNNSRYRSSDPFSHDPGHAPASAGQGASDPLAELARLIGKNDPFAELGRSSHPPASHAPASYAPEPPPREPYREPRFDDHAPQSGYQADHHHDSQQRQDARYDAPFPAPSGWDATAQPAPGYDPFAPHGQPAPLSADTRYEDHPYAAGAHSSGQPQPVIDNYQPGYDPHQLDTNSSYDNENAARLGAPLGDVPGFGPPPFHPAESGAAQPSEDQFYDDAPPRRRKGLVTVAAVLVLAVVGTAAAFGYRSYRGGSGSLSLPTIIKASTEPTKVAPPAPQPNADASKISYDRFGDRGQNEKVVSREEQPVDQREIVRSSSVPRTVLPGAPTPSPNASASAANNPPNATNNAPSANPPSALGEPKRIRTVPIRPDQPDVSAASNVAKQMSALPAPPPQASPQAAQPLPAPQQQTFPPPPAPVEATPAPQRAAAPPPAPVERAPRAQRTAPPPANAPLSLAPDANASAPPAALPPPRTSAPMQVASAPSNGGTGSGRYHVQVSSQRSESDAQAAFRSVQGKYSSVLGGQQHSIRKVELGEKGTYYRAMVGPFATRDQAVQLCSSLKSAGGDCVVQSN